MSYQWSIVRKEALTKNANLKTSQPFFNLVVDVGLAKVNSDGPGLNCKLLLCEGRKNSVSILQTIVDIEVTLHSWCENKIVHHSEGSCLHTQHTQHTHSYIHVSQVAAHCVKAH